MQGVKELKADFPDKVVIASIMCRYPTARALKPSNSKQHKFLQLYYLASHDMPHCSYSKEDWQELAILAVRLFINFDRTS